MNYIEGQKKQKKLNGFQKSLNNCINTEKCCITAEETVEQNQQVTESLKSMI